MNQPDFMALNIRGRMTEEGMSWAEGVEMAMDKVADCEFLHQRNQSHKLISTKSTVIKTEFAKRQANAVSAAVSQARTTLLAEMQTERNEREW